MAKAKTPASKISTAIALAGSALALLTTLSQAGENGMYAANGADLLQLSTLGYAEVNPSQVAEDGSGNVAARISATGTAYLASLNSGNGAAFQPPATGSASGATAAVAPASSFAILKNVTLPGVIRGRSVGAAKYPFETLEVGDAFFVAATAERPDPADGLGSTVSSATRRYAVPGTPPTKEVTRVKRGPDRKAVIGPNGEKVKETVTVENLIPTRVFEMRAIADGTAYGHPGVKGALIGRTK